MLLTIVDPCSLVIKRSAAVPKAPLSSNLCGLSKDKGNDHSIGNLHIREEEPSMLQSTYEINSSLPKSKDLWDVVNEVVHLLIEENVLYLEKQKEATLAKSMSTKTKFYRSCPIMLLRDTNHTSLLTRWSIILPLNWVKAFQIPLVCSGAHVVSLREEHWIACDVGFPYSPLDFLDCSAYSCFMKGEVAEECCTLDRRSLKVLIPPPLSNINFGFDKVAGQVNVIDTSSNTRSYDYLADFNCKILDATPVNNSGSSCELLIVSSDHLLLFTKRPDGTSFSNLMKDEVKLSQAYKKVIFDEGAAICTPRFSNLSLWTFRFITFALQIPFTQNDSML
ncbi:hypothetical protein Cgig2_003829 [Carnegiea gigantea]|uniref:POPLD domain-containing protein n=1 Tax=Carnegiea gigantea TaxID=171969 RepID=A0A9Q1KNC4_9CARY|nr:hypothetical protein Cgig2_003829 [Carnegiea gigantea]